jgi:hypothetical protein
MKRILSIVFVFGLAVLSAWLLPFAREQRHLYFKDYTFTADEAQRLKRHPEILYAHGRQAERRMDNRLAMDLYRRTTAGDALQMSAWLRLAELTAAAGELQSARRMTDFCNAYIGPVLRWKWPHTLLAHGLGMETIFSANVNYLVARRTKLNDALNLLDTHCQGSPAAALAALAPGNQPAYLDWAIRWKRPAAAQAAWQQVTASGLADAGMLVDYVHFLVAQRQVPAAAAVWRQHTGIAGMTNGGFESESTRKGFDWRIGSEREGHWDVRRAAFDGRSGAAALHVRFDGRANVNFYHLSQVVAVTPQTPCRLAFWWHEKGLTTDQLPFVEVSGYDAKGLYARSPALQGARRWQREEMTFTPPADCHAVVVRLRRRPSDRFDNKIRGSLWLDDFELIETAGGQAAAATTNDGAPAGT